MTSPQHSKQSRVRPSDAPGVLAMEISHPTIPPLAGAAPELASPAPSDWLGCTVGIVCGLEPSPGKGVLLCIACPKTLQAASAKVAVSHFPPPFQCFVSLPHCCFKGETSFLIPLWISIIFWVYHSLGFFQIVNVGLFWSLPFILVVFHRCLLISGHLLTFRSEVRKKPIGSSEPMDEPCRLLALVLGHLAG